MSEWIALIPHELKDIGVGLRSIVYDGRDGFGLEGPALIGFVRRSLHALVARGAIPWQWGQPGTWELNKRIHYGSDTPDEMVEGVIADWQARGDLEWEDFWFALPQTFRDSR